MDNLEHTPGPWRTYRLNPDSSLDLGLIVTTRDEATEICGIVNREADAKLIAACPELLAACKYVADLTGTALDATQAATLGKRCKAAIELALKGV